MLYPKFLHNLRQQALYKPFWALCELSQNIIFNSENSLHSYYASINITYIYMGDPKPADAVSIDFCIFMHYIA